MKNIALTIKQLWALKIVFNSIFNALEKKEDGNYYIDNKKFFLALNGKEFRSLLQISCKL